MLTEAIQLHQAGNLVNAEHLYRQILTANPQHSDALHLLGVIAYQCGQNAAAVQLIRSAIEINESIAVYHNNLGNVLNTLGQDNDALNSYNYAIKFDKYYADAYSNLGAVLSKLNRLDEAVSAYATAIHLKSNLPEPHYNLGNALKELNRLDEAIQSYERALSLDPVHAYARGALLWLRTLICNWAEFESDIRQISINIQGGQRVARPFTMVALSEFPKDQLLCAQTWIRDRHPPAQNPLWNGQIYHHPRIRVAYLSADFNYHATAYLMAELFELHDRARFEIVGISFGQNDDSAMRHRLIEAFDQFHDVQSLNHFEAAKLIRGLEIDIVVDLKGHTAGARPTILAHRPAPVQVAYLGYPGSMGADFIDYVIADPIVLPFDQQPYYTEEIVHLPDCYQPNDRQRKISETTPTRRQVGLPDTGFVFCCFNNNYKINPPIFDVWMRLLDAVEHSVLWLLRDLPTAEVNLRREAAARGIDPSRLVFADRAPTEDHLARHRLADLFLDTLPCNAHTTASDALWAGLPVLTCLGKTFAGRVAASLLHAIGLPELVTNSFEEYEALAFHLATHPDSLAAIKARLAANRLTHPLFDTPRLCRNLEAVYIDMWERQQKKFDTNNM